MDDIRRLDAQVFAREAGRPDTLVFFTPLAALVIQALRPELVVLPQSMLVFLSAFGVLMGAGSTYQRWSRRRFRDPRFAALWEECHDRIVRFRDATRRMRRAQVAELREMPTTIERVGEALYASLRRADVIVDELRRSEQGLIGSQPSWTVRSSDPQAQELLQVADRNIAEYRGHFHAVMAGVHRTEAQCAVFVTTLDALRMRMLGQRMVGRRPEMDSHGFLSALAEAKVQLQAIDTALEELDLRHYPERISVVRPNAAPEEARLEVRE